MSDDRSRRFVRVSSESAAVAGVVGGIAAIFAVMAVFAYNGTSPGELPSGWVPFLALAALLIAPFSAAFAAVSYLTGTLAETERMN